MNDQIRYESDGGVEAVQKLIAERGGVKELLKGPDGRVEHPHLYKLLRYYESPTTNCGTGRN